MIFRDFIKREKDKWGTEGTKTLDKLRNLARKNYSHMATIK